MLSKKNPVGRPFIPWNPTTQYTRSSPAAQIPLIQSLTRKTKGGAERRSLIQSPLCYVSILLTLAKKLEIACYTCGEIAVKKYPTDMFPISIVVTEFALEWQSSQLTRDRFWNWGILDRHLREERSNHGLFGGGAKKIFTRGKLSEHSQHSKLNVSWSKTNTVVWYWRSSRDIGQLREWETAQLGRRGWESQTKWQPIR